MPRRPPPRLHKLSRDELRSNPPTHEERRLAQFLSSYSMLLRQGNLEAADALQSALSRADQTTVFEVCQEKRRGAANDTTRFGRVILANERKAVEKEESSRGRQLTGEEIEECLKQERNRPRRRKDKGAKEQKPSKPKLSKKEKARRRQANGNEG